ncbi:RNA polymerase subunit sigma-24 [Humibacillus sp. DSM 29435]|uniref:RNA polymerase sigma factor n=1 Tax=Humibacillus sp. DSM 29435 TaxID=1869167 RepID=UPI000872BE1A|nr:sigma-70 family RNA polymerase sigma factor [Humibacillus sp. DSM 29435]OFE15643.1 RNA polymerase subunit sigma-24 [Humibacillus sp. DSM 29435]
METGDRAVEDLWRRLAPQVIGALVRRYGWFDLAEDATQEALLAASTQWPDQGVPDDPRAWLITVASRRLIDHLRSEEARARREAHVAQRTATVELASPAVDLTRSDDDDTLVMLFLCCHDTLTTASQIVLTLRAVGGLTTAEIAAAFLVPESTMAQRISRAKSSIRASGAAFRMPSAPERVHRMPAVLRVLYLIFNEGYTATFGAELQRLDLSTEAIRLTRQLLRLLPEDGEVAGLLALMLLTDSRRGARTTPEGRLVPLEEQNRESWHTASADEGVALVTGALRRATLGSYQVQAAIAAVHAEASTAAQTDWAQIVALYDLLRHLDPSPMVDLNRAVAVGMASGAPAGLAALAEANASGRLDRHHRLHAVHAHLLEMVGDLEPARAAYRRAARLTTSRPEQRYLQERADRL